MRTFVTSDKERNVFGRKNKNRNKYFKRNMNDLSNNCQIDKLSMVKKSEVLERDRRKISASTYIYIYNRFLR